MPSIPANVACRFRPSVSPNNRIQLTADRYDYDDLLTEAYLDGQTEKKETQNQVIIHLPLQCNDFLSPFSIRSTAECLKASWRHSSDGRTERFRGASRGKGKVGLLSFPSFWITAAPADAISFSVIIVQPVDHDCLVPIRSLKKGVCQASSPRSPSLPPQY